MTLRPEVINNEPNVFNSRHEANESIIFRDQKEKVINKTSKLDATRGYQQILTIKVTKHELLLWWYRNKQHFPKAKLSKVVKYILSVPASSVPSEELFKTVGDVYTNKRACLLASKGGKFCCSTKILNRSCVSFYM